MAEPMAPPQSHVDLLRRRPETAEFFDKRYGAGAASRALNADKGVLGYAADIGAGVVHGALRAVDETSDSLASGLDMAGSATGVESIQDIEPLNYSESLADTGLIERPTSTVGGLAEGLTQFAVGWLGVGKLTRWVKPVKKGAVVAAAAGKGAAVDAFAFDPHEERLSNLVNGLSEKHPSLANPVTEFLAAKPDDPEALGRLKNAIEGLGLGIAAEGVVHGLKYLKAKRTGTPEEAQAALDELAERSEAEAPDAPEGTGGDVEAPATPAGTADTVQAPEGTVASPEAQGVPAEAPPAVLPDAAAPAPEGAPAPAAQRRQVRLSQNEMDAVVRDFDQTLGTVEAIHNTPHATVIDVKDTLVTDRLNWNVVGHGDDVTSLMDAAVDQLQRRRPGVLSQPQAWEKTAKIARRLYRMAGVSPEKGLETAAAAAKNGDEFASRIGVAHLITDSLGTRLTRLLQMEKDGVFKDPELGVDFGTAEEIAKEIDKTSAHFLEAVGYVTRVRSGAGRALHYAKVAGKITPELREHMRAGAEHGVEGLAASMRLPKASFRKWWINAMLSGVKTHVVNTVSNAANAFILPMERGVAGIIRRAKGETDNWQELRESGDQIAGMFTEGWEAITAAGRAFRRDENTLDTGSIQAPEGDRAAHRAVPVAEGVDAATQSVEALKAGDIGRAAALAFKSLVVLGDNTITLPTRALLAGDELFKQLTYRSAVRAKALREGRQRGLSGTALQQHVDTRFDDAFDFDGQASRDEFGELKFSDAFHQAREATFTQTLEPGTWGSSLQQLSAKHPLANIIFPFVKTPTNIIRWAWYRTPGFNVLHSQWRKEWGAATPEKKALMQARMVTGSVLWMTAVGLASNGQVTGGGPANPVQARLLKSTGWQPYSKVIRNEDGSVEYRAYNRADPYGMFIGLAADMTELHAMSKVRPDDELYLAAVQAVAKNLASKTYLRGLFDFVGALSDPERGAGRFVNSFAGSLIPAALNTRLSEDDPMVEVRSVVDALRSRTPGLSEGLDPQRNILGEVIYSAEAWGPDFASPVAKRVQKDPQNDVAVKLFDLLYQTDDTINYPPRTENGVSWLDYRTESGQTAYDRYLELMQQPRTDIPPMREALERAFDAFEKTSVPREKQIEVVRGVIGKYRMAAKATTLNEFKDLRLDLIGARVQEATGALPEFAQ